MLRGICPSVSHPGIAETMDPAGTESREGEPMFGRAVTAIASEAVAGVGLGEGAHRVVTYDLGHDARGRDRRAPGVGPGQTLHLRAEIQVPIREATPGAVFQGGESPGQGLAVRRAYTVTVDPPGWERYDGDGLGPAEQRAENSLPQLRPQQFGVVDPGDLTFAEDDGRGH